jgi:hypothetical protein
MFFHVAFFIIVFFAFLVLINFCIVIAAYSLLGSVGASLAKPLHMLLISFSVEERILGNRHRVLLESNANSFMIRAVQVLNETFVFHELHRLCQNFSSNFILLLSPLMILSLLPFAKVKHVCGASLVNGLIEVQG